MNDLTYTMRWWLDMLAKGLHPVNFPRRRPKDATASDAETLLGLRRRELIDKDGRITDAGKAVVRIGGR